MDPTFLRQQDLVTPRDLRGLDLDIVGAGMLGGAVLLCLMKMGFGLESRILVTDFDHCEPHNLPTQWFRPGDAMLGLPKVQALADLVAWVADRHVVPVKARFTGGESRPLGPIVVLAVDSLEERARIWAALRERNDVRLLIDARAGAEVVEVHALEPGKSDPAVLERSLEGEAAEEPCTRRAIAYAPFAAAAIVGSVVRAWVRREPFPPRVTMDVRNFWIERAEPE